MAAGRRPGGAASGINARPVGARTGVRPASAVAARAAPVVAAARPTRLRRVAMLGVITIVLAVLLAPAMRSYVAQRHRVDVLAAQVAHQRAQLGDLQRQRAAWDDPAYVRAQARNRLRFVMPGDRTYTVIEPGGSVSGAPAPVVRRPAAPPVPAGGAWFGDLWRSARSAGDAAGTRR